MNPWTAAVCYVVMTVEATLVPGEKESWPSLISEITPTAKFSLEFTSKPDLCQSWGLDIALKLVKKDLVLSPCTLGMRKAEWPNTFLENDYTYRFSGRLGRKQMLTTHSCTTEATQQQQQHDRVSTGPDSKQTTNTLGSLPGDNPGAVSHHPLQNSQDFSCALMWPEEP